MIKEFLQNLFGTNKPATIKVAVTETKVSETVTVSTGAPATKTVSTSLPSTKVVETDLSGEKDKKSPYWYRGTDPGPSPTKSSKLLHIPVIGIYDSNKDKISNDQLPNHLAWLADWNAESFLRMKEKLDKEGIPLFLSDMFRSYESQAKLYKEKPTLAKPPGSSYHEAGAAYDFSIEAMGDRLFDAYLIFESFGWYPLWYVRKSAEKVRNKMMSVKEFKTTKESWHIQRTVEIDEKKKFQNITEAITYVGNNK